MDTTENQYSIYKINYEQTETFFDIKSSKDTPEYFMEIVDVLINSSINIISKKKHSTIKQVNYNGFKGIFFKTFHDPSWNDLAHLFIKNSSFETDSNNSEEFIKNSNISYILFYIVKNSVFVMTGGYGSNYISKFTEKNFGLYLIPKVFNKDNSVVKLAIQNSLMGNHASSQHANRIATSFNMEQDMSNIFRQLGVEADYEIAEKLGIQFEDGESTNKKINILNKDSLVIRRSISLNQLVIILKKIEALEKSKDKFVLNYLVLAKKKGLKNSDLNQILVNDIVNERTEQFILVGDDYESYYMNANKYIIWDSVTKNVLIEQEAPITFDDVLNIVRNSKFGITSSSVGKMLKKYELSTYDNSGNTLLSPISLIDSIQGHIEFETNNTPCFLFNGMWYVIDKKYEDQLKESFEFFISETSSEASKILTDFLPNLKAASENDYNEKLLDNENIIVAHTVLNNYIEIADAFFYDDSNIYFMHNKSKFDGIGARDVTNQVLTAAEYFERQMQHGDKNEFLEKYYFNIERMYEKNEKKLLITKDKFIEILSSSRKKSYIVGYVKSFSKSSRSNYAKYLSVELWKKINAKGFGLYIVGLK